MLPGESVVMRLLAHDAQRAKIVFKSQHTGELASWRKSVDRLTSSDQQSSETLRESLGIRSLARAQQEALDEWHMMSSEAEQLYYEALYLDHRFQSGDSVSLLRKANEQTEGNSLLLLTALARNLVHFGENREAVPFIRTGLSFCGSPTGEHRERSCEMLLALAGQAEAEWAQAVKHERKTLYSWFPDDPFRGLSFVETLSLAGSGSGDIAYFREAHSELRRLRGLHESDVNGGIFDSVEASISLLQEEYAKAESLSQDAQSKAKKAGLNRTEAVAALIQARAIMALNPERNAEANELRLRAQATLRELNDHERLGVSLEEAASMYEGFDLPQAAELFREAAAAYQTAGYKTGMGRVLFRLAVVLENMGKHEESNDVLAKSQDLIGSEDAGYFSLQEGYSQHLAGNLDEALRHYQDAKYLFDLVSNREGYGIALTNLGEIYYLQGAFADAEELHREALRIHERHGSKLEILYDNFCIGRVAAAHRDLTTAERYYELASSGDKEISIQVNIALAELDIFRQEFRSAKMRLESALELAKSADLIALRIRIESALARASLHQGELADAEAATTAARELLEIDEGRASLWDFRALWEFQVALASLESARGNVTQAVERLQTVQSDAIKNGILIYEFEAGLVLGEIELQAGRVQQGRSRLESLQERATKIGFTQIENRIDAILG